MELLFGTHVRSGGRRIGYLAGLEVDAASRRVTKIIFSDDGKLGSHAHTRPIAAVRQERGALAVHDAPTAITPGQPILLSRSVRVVRSGRDTGRVSGVALGEDGALQAVFARQHWWTRRTRLATDQLDFAAPGEIRLRSEKTMAA